MAAHLKLISLLFLLFTLSFHAAEARDSQFFSKEVRSNTPKENPRENPETTPSTSKPEDVQSTPDTDTNNGYGLYGREAGTEEFPNNNNYQTGLNTENEEFSTNEGDTTVWYPAKEFDNNAEFKQRYPTKEYGTDEPTNRYDSNRYASKEYDEDQLRSNKGAYKEREPSNKYAPKEYNDQLRSNKGYQAEREHFGMSDTRFLENGRYFHDIKNEGRQNAYSGKTETEGGYDRGAGRKSGYDNNYNREWYENEDPQVEPEEEYVP